MVLCGTSIPEETEKRTPVMAKERTGAHEESGVRRRILGAAFAEFRKSGYAGTSTLVIATRARVSKRELYALVGNKQEILTACIRERAKRFKIGRASCRERV